MEAEAIVVHYPAMIGEHPEARLEPEPEAALGEGEAGGQADAERPVDPGAELIGRHLRGDRDAFGELLALYRAPVYGYFLRGGLPVDVADDLFQDTFLRVHQHARSYSSDRSFRVWLFTIAHNLVKSHHRKRLVRRILVDWWAGPPGDERAFDPPEPGPGPAESALTREALRLVERTLAKLPEGSRQALLLTQVEGLKLTEAADVLGVPLSTVKTWIHRGRRELALAQRAPGGGVEV